MTAQRKHKPKLTKADYDRAAAFLKAVGATVAVVEVAPGAAKIITTEGRELTLPDDDAELDRELREHIAARGYGSA